MTGLVPVPTTELCHQQEVPSCPEHIELHAAGLGRRHACVRVRVHCWSGHSTVPGCRYHLGLLCLVL
jgi:hypothetical protein